MNKPAVRDEGNGPAALLLVEARRDEGPDLVDDPGGSEKDGAQQRQFHPDDGEALHGRKLDQAGGDAPDVSGRRQPAP